MFRLFENMVDPYTPYKEVDTPPQRLWPFLWDYAQPFRRVFAIAAVLAVVVAALEVWLIYYLGRVVDLLSGGQPAEVWAAHGVELILMALFMLILRPAIQGVAVLFLNNA
ncbi:MAG: multidrug ABC transporter ATP-binding protein, partial [Pseudomonadota bacterium]